MPRNVRNFWMEGGADGAARRAGFGPRAKDGGASLTVYQRSAGEATEGVRVRCYADANGLLETEVSADSAEAPALRVTTSRDGAGYRVELIGGAADTLAECVRQRANALALEIEREKCAATRAILREQSERVTRALSLFAPRVRG